MNTSITNKAHEKQRRYAVHVNLAMHEKLSLIAKATDRPITAVLHWFLADDIDVLIEAIKDAHVPRNRGRKRKIFHPGVQL